MLIDPAVVARLGAVLADAFEAGAGILIQRPAFGAVIAGRGRPIEHPALAPVEAADVAARKRDPHHALAVDIAAARAEAGHGHVVDFRQRRLRRVGAGFEAHDGAGARADGPPNRTVHRARHHRIEHLRNALVLRGVDRLIGLDIIVALPVAVGVEDERGPTLRFRGISGLVKHLGVEPADHAPASSAARPQRIVGVVTELQVVRLEARIDECVFHRFGVEHRKRAVSLLQREQLGGRMRRALLAEVRVLGAAHCRGHPHPPLLVDHGIVIVDLGVPDLLVAPVGRRAERLCHGRVARSQRFGRIRIAHRRVEDRHLVGLGIENRDHVRRVFGRTVDRAMRIHRWVASVR